MPSTMTRRSIYFASSFSELQKKAEFKDFKPNHFERIASLSEKFYDNAKQQLEQGDDERAYFYFYRFMTLLNHIQDCDKEKYLNKFGKKSVQVLNYMEVLSKRLRQRYAEKQKSYEERKAEVFSQQSIPGTSIKVSSNDCNNDTIENDDDDDYKYIDSVQLVQYIQSLSEINKILIIDIRSSSNFEKSCIAANKLYTTGEVNIINIPNENIAPGITCANLIRLKQVNFGLTLDALERRRSMDRVVIMDEHTFDFDKTSKCVILADALWKWDQSPDIIKFKPYLLKGGFSDFILTYPTSTTNSKYDAKQNDQFLIQRKSFQTKLFYDSDEEQEMQENIPTTPSSELSTPKKESLFNDSLSHNNATSNSLPDRSVMFDMFSKSNTNNKTKFPGVAKPVIPDRSSKPQLFSSKFNNDVSIKVVSESAITKYNHPSSTSSFASLNNSLKTSSKMNEEISNFSNDSNNSFNTSYHPPTSFDNKNSARNSLNNGDSKMQIDDELVAGNFDDDNDFSQTKLLPLATPVHKKHQIQKMFQLDEDMSDDEDETANNQLDGEDIEKPHSVISKPITMINNNTNHYNNHSNFSSSLSRSLSSPNIAQFEQESQDSSYHSVGSGTPKFTNQIPIVDRSVKPLPYQAALRKSRDFSPQFSSCARITGLRNLGNTCFMNSIIQCLNNTTELNEYLRSGSVYINSNSKFGSNGELTIELMELFKQMVYPSNYKHISPRDFKDAVSRHIPDFVDYKQQDAHEFLVRFLDRVHSDLNQCKPNANLYDPVTKDPNYYDQLSITTAANSFWTLHLKRNKSIIADLFEGLIVSTLTCLHCSYTSKALEAFTCLSLPIQEGGRFSLKNSLSLFLRRERITDEVAWLCPTCKQKRDADKCTYIWKLPKILVIHLKRFSYDGMWRQKISTFVDFPIENLLIEARDGEETRSYSLYGVVNHTGSLDGGHYIAFSRNKDLNIGWHRYDDQDVSPVSASDVITQNAYVLFYKSS